MRAAVKLGLLAASFCAGAMLLQPKDAIVAASDLPVIEAPPSGPRTRYIAGQHAQLVTAGGTAQTVKSLLNVPHRMRYGEYRWDDAGVPPGLVWVRVDLANQTLSVFRAGHEIGTSVILFGTDGKPTPTGDFPILQRAAKHRSNLYDADMPFMLRLTNDGVAIHASDVRAGAATHGCIGIPPAFAERLFEQVRRGDIVAILPERAVANS